MIAQFLNYLRNCKEYYDIASEERREAENETQDILHCLELHENSYHDFAKLARALSKTRKERRVAKDREAIAGPIIEWEKANQKTIHDLERLLGTVRAAEAATERRLYNPKTDILGRVFGEDQK